MHLVNRDQLDGMDVASAWLRNHRPIDYFPGVMHGDYQFANVMFEHGAPAKLAALLDREMGTVGDPKLDLGWMVQSWPDDTNTAAVNSPTCCSSPTGTRCRYRRGSCPAASRPAS